MEDKERMADFIDELEYICRKYNVVIENLCDNCMGTPHAVAKFKGTDDYYNIDMTFDNGYNVGEPIYYK